jgi:hypothetical protein
MTDDDLTEVIREILTEVHALRQEQVRQANELNQIKTTVYRIEQNLQQRIRV